MLKKKKKTTKKKIYWQTHHITYDPEYTVRVRRSEHFYITKLARYRNLSAGAYEAIFYIISTKPLVHEDKADQLNIPDGAVRLRNDENATS